MLGVLRQGLSYLIRFDLVPCTSLRRHSVQKSPSLTRVQVTSHTEEMTFLLPQQTVS